MLINCICNIVFIGTTAILKPYMTFNSCWFGNYSYSFFKTMVDNKNVLLNMLMLDQSSSKNYTLINNMYSVFIGKEVFFYYKESNNAPSI